MRNCSDCVMAVSCDQLRARDCHNVTFYLNSPNQPVIEVGTLAGTTPPHSTPLYPTPARSAPPCLISPSPILPHPTPPFLKLSDNIAFAPLNVAYPQLPGQLETAGLDPTRNLWFAPYDFNDEERTGKNWRLLAEEEEEGLWCPLGECEAVIPRVEAGSIEVPTDDTGEAHPSPRDAPYNAPCSVPYFAPYNAPSDAHPYPPIDPFIHPTT